MELAAKSHLRGMILQSRWLLSLQKEEADALSDFKLHSFDQKLRIDIEEDDMGQFKLPFLLLNDLFDAGDAYISELATIKEKEKAAAKASGGAPPWRTRKLKEEGLKDKDPLRSLVEASVW